MTWFRNLLLGFTTFLGLFALPRVSFFHPREGTACLPPRAPGVSTGHGLEAAA